MFMKISKKDYGEERMMKSWEGDGKKEYIEEQGKRRFITPELQGRVTLIVMYNSSNSKDEEVALTFFISSMKFTLGSIERLKLTLIALYLTR